MNIYVGDEVFRIAVEIRPDAERRIEAMLAKIDKAIAQAFAEFMERVTSRQAIDTLADLIASGKIEDAANFAARYSEPIGLRIMDAYRAAALFETTLLQGPVEAVQVAAGGSGVTIPPSIAALFDRLPKPSVAISFDPSSPRAVDAMRTMKDEFLTNFNEGQREVIRDAITKGLQEGSGAREVARDIKGVIGLTKPQADALDRYRKQLEGLDRDALSGVTRDKRFDGTVRKAIKDGKSLDPATIDKMVEARRRKMLKARSEQIAINESAKALNRGREEGLRQMVEASGIDPALVTREWRSLRDSRVRDTHIVLDGQRTGLDGVFLSPSGATLRYPRDPNAPAHETQGCRCFTVHKIRTPK